MKLYDLSFRIRREDYTLTGADVSTSYNKEKTALECTSTNDFYFRFKQTIQAQDVFEAERYLKNNASIEALKQLVTAKMANLNIRVPFDLDHITFEF